MFYVNILACISKILRNFVKLLVDSFDKPEYTENLFLNQDFLKTF